MVFNDSILQLTRQYGYDRNKNVAFKLKRLRHYVVGRKNRLRKTKEIIMKIRIRIGKFLIRLGDFISALAVTVMKPDDLIELSRKGYADSIEYWNQEKLVDSGLTKEELSLLEKIPLKKGRLLLLGVGGGREAIPLAQLGFTVTAVDYIPEMIEKAKENALKKGVAISGLVQEISRINIPDNSYDIVWLSAKMYSCIPTKNRRIRMLHKIRKALRPEGYFAFQFFWNINYKPTLIGELIKRYLAFLTLGNLDYEKGDVLLRNAEFIHFFSSEDKLKLEFKDTGFKLLHMCIYENIHTGVALLQKSLPQI